MENASNIFSPILQGNENDIYAIEFFLTYPISNWTNQVFWYTRQYRSALDFFEKAEMIFQQYGKLLRKDKRFNLKLQIMRGKLLCYDYLDWFQEYITFYKKNYSYLDDYKERYRLIKKKQHLLETGKPIGNLVHKTRDMLSDDEKQIRDEYLLRTFDVYFNQYKELQSKRRI